MSSADSQRAFDCFLKVRSVLENGGRVVCATATPVSNTMADVISRRRCDHNGGFPPFCIEVNATVHRRARDQVVFIQ
jgi:hypothetical protein